MAYYKKETDEKLAVLTGDSSCAPCGSQLLAHFLLFSLGLHALHLEQF